MAIRNWSARTIRWLWVGLLAGYAILLLPGIVRTRMERRAAQQVIEVQQRHEDSVQRAMAPAQRARADSLRDSARALLRSIGGTVLAGLSTPKGKSGVRAFETGLLGAWITAVTVLLAPIVALIVVTAVWWTGPKHSPPGSGA